VDPKTKKFLSSFIGHEGAIITSLSIYPGTMTMSAKKATCEGIKGDPKFIELLKLRI
jgi:hypothetical protein